MSVDDELQRLAEPAARERVADAPRRRRPRTAADADVWVDRELWVERPRRVSGPVNGRVDASSQPEPAVPTAHEPTPERRTITITGRGAERYYPVATHRQSSGRSLARSSYDHSGFRPDRMAMWAVLLGVALILAAATSSHAATLALHAAAHAPH